MQTEKWIVGTEYDEAAFTRLKCALISLRYNVQCGWVGTAASQDIHQWTADCLNGRLVIESETYIGLSVEGPTTLVAELRSQYERVV